MSFRFTRRSFLKSTALCFDAAAFAISDDNTQNEEKDVWAIVSDMHISEWTETPPEHNVRFQSVINAMLAEPVKPRRIFLLGDNVYSGKQEQYKRLLEILQPAVDAGIGIHAALGDHDNLENFRAIREKLLPPEAKADKSITHFVRTEPWATGDDKHIEILETQRANFFVLDSLVKTNQEEGKFGKEQLDWLAAELDKRKDKPAVLMAHHVAVDVSKFADGGLADAIPFWKIIGKRRQVKAFFFGHSHYWFNHRSGNVHQVNFPSIYRCPPLSVLGWVLMTLHDDGVCLTLKTCDPADKRNGQQVNLRFV